MERPETSRNHPKQAETNRNHPKPPATTQKFCETTRNQPLNISKMPTQPKNSLQHQIYTFLVPKIKNCQILMKFGILIKSIMLNKMVMMIFLFYWHLSLLGQFSPKNENCQILMKFGILIKSIMLNKMVMMIFFFVLLTPVTFGPIWSQK